MSSVLEDLVYNMDLLLAIEVKQLQPENTIELVKRYCKREFLEDYKNLIQRLNEKNSGIEFPYSTIVTLMPDTIEEILKINKY